MQLAAAHELLEATIEGVTPDQLHFMPEGRALPIGAAYAHVLFSEDILIATWRGEKPRFETGVETGASEPMPNFMHQDWGAYPAWTKAATFDLAKLRAYAGQVYAASDAYLAKLTAADLDQEDSVSKNTMAFNISRALIGHVDNLAGEISAAKGLQGLQGYPF
jgi:hypothetical protein